jgi:dTDP-4-amino-4,6-dideoxygalactose transaminase
MITRRNLFTAAAAGTVARNRAAGAETPALTGGKPVRSGPFAPWPVFDNREEQALLETLRSGHWLRISGQNVNRFERAWAAAIGTKGCVATCNGTSALFLSLKALGVGPGDEVIVPPYTFIATVNAVLLLYALPVFVDTDPETAQIDARKIEASITGRTAAILPVHIGGSAADMDTILAIAGRRKLPVVEDACQAHFGEWRGKRLGGWGTTGCFSFQSTKNLACGEGGALVSNDQELLQKCFAIHSHGRPPQASGYNFTYQGAGTNLRMDEFRAAVAAVQLTRVEQQAETRDRNARYLTGMLSEIPGIEPLRMYPGCTRNAWHLYMFRYRPEAFAGLPRRIFLRALAAEGINAASGYAPLNREAFLKNTLAERHFQAIFSKQRLAEWEERNQCPANDKFCGEAVWFSQSTLLGKRTDMEQIVEAIRKIRTHASRLLKL